MTRREPFTGSRGQRALDVAGMLILVPLYLLAILFLVATAIIWVPILFIAYARRQKRLHGQMRSDRPGKVVLPTGNTAKGGTPQPKPKTVIIYSSTEP
jgi:hypothetical protein